MEQYIVEDGMFARACQELLESGYRIPYVEVDPAERGVKVSEETGGDPSKRKYSCPKCGLNVWGTEDLRIICADCRRLLEMKRPKRAGYL